MEALHMAVEWTAFVERVVCSCRYYRTLSSLAKVTRNVCSNGDKLRFVPFPSRLVSMRASSLAGCGRRLAGKSRSSSSSAVKSST